MTYKIIIPLGTPLDKVRSLYDVVTEEIHRDINKGKHPNPLDVQLKRMYERYLDTYEPLERALREIE